MNNKISFRKFMIVGLIAILAFAFAITFTPAQAVGPGGEGNFKAIVKHRLNGEKLGLDRALPVDVYINGQKAIENFRYGDTLVTSLPAGNYFIELYFAGTVNSTGLTLGPVDVPEGVNVSLIARNGADGPFIEARIRPPKMRK